MLLSITIWTGSPIPIIFQFESNELFHCPGIGIIEPPVYAVRVRPVLSQDVPGTVRIFHGSFFVIFESISCSSMSPVAREYD